MSIPEVIVLEAKDEKREAIEAKYHAIMCPRYGGLRYAHCCIYYDRYKACRRRCEKLKAHLAKYPTLSLDAATFFKDRKKNIKHKEDEPKLIEIAHKYAGKNLPDPKLSCIYCDFVGKSERGLKIHLKRTHKK